MTPIPETPKYDIGAKIVSARKRTGISQENFAPLVGTTRRHLIRLEKGRHRPSADLLARIAEATGQPESFFRSTPRQDGASGAVDGDGTTNDRQGVHGNAA